MQEYPIEFDCWENDEPLQIQLEPEALVFKVTYPTSLKFLARCEQPFTWAVRVCPEDRWIQLFPECKHEYEIIIYEGNTLLENWYKYM